MILKRWADRDNYREVEQEWKYEWIFYILSHMGLEDEILQECFPEGGFADFDVKHRLKLREHCDAKNITILDDRDGGVKIYVQIVVDGQAVQEKVAEWKKCHFNLREDPEAIRPSDRTFIEIVADPWDWTTNEETE